MPSAPVQPFPWPPARTRLACPLFLPSRPPWSWSFSRFGGFRGPVDPLGWSTVASSCHLSSISPFLLGLKDFTDWRFGDQSINFGNACDPIWHLIIVPSVCDSLAIKHFLTQVYSSAECWFKLFNYTSRKPAMENLQLGLVAQMVLTSERRYCPRFLVLCCLWESWLPPRPGVRAFVWTHSDFMGKVPTLTGVPLPGFRRDPARHGLLAPASKKPRGAPEHSGGLWKVCTCLLEEKARQTWRSGCGKQGRQRVELVERLARLELRRWSMNADPVVSSIHMPALPKIVEFHNVEV